MCLQFIRKFLIFGQTSVIPTGDNVSNKKINILVVEDDDELRNSLQRQLSEKDYDVITASNGNEAIPLTHARRYDLVILDLKMPYLDGFQVLQFLNSTFPDTRVIVLTGYGDLKNVERCKSLGANEVMSKPYNVEYLFDTINRLVKREVP